MQAKGLESYFLVPEGFQQADGLLRRQREAQAGARVDVGHLDVLVAEVALPLGVATHLVLPEDVRD